MSESTVIKNEETAVSNENAVIKNEKAEKTGSSLMKGAFLTIFGGILWGFSGTCGQFLMQGKGLTSNWLVPHRLLLAGSILLIICYLRMGKHILDIWKQDAKSIVIFGIFGMSMCQYTYFTAISASNAGTATVLQYLGPVLIMVLFSVLDRHLPRPIELIALGLAVLGTFLLATHGNPGSMVLSKEALFWGLLAAVALVIYTVQPAKMLDQYGSQLVSAWGMLIGGVMLMIIFRPWSIPVKIDGQVVAGLAAIVVFGTVISFSAYLEGVRLVGPKKGSLFASVEPVAATIFSVVWMHVEFGIVDILGFVCIISTIFLLSVDKN